MKEMIFGRLSRFAVATMLIAITCITVPLYGEDQPANGPELEYSITVGDSGGPAINDPVPPTPTPSEQQQFRLRNNGKYLPFVEKPADVPSVLIVTDALPAGKYTAPVGKFKELADVIVTRIRQDKLNGNWHAAAYVTDNEKPDKRELVIVYPEAKQVTFKFKSNCSVNSVFEVNPKLSDFQQHNGDPNSLIYKEWYTDVLASWAQMNHGWNNKTAIIPKTFKVLVFSYSDNTCTLDVSYARTEVQAYNQAVAVQLKINDASVASR